MRPALRRAGVAALAALIWIAVATLIGLKAMSITLVIVTFVGACAFCAVYARRHWRTPIGWNIMAMAVVIAIETGLAIVALLFGADWPARDLIRALAWTLIAGVLWWRVALVAWPPPPPLQHDELADAHTEPKERNR